MFDVPALPPDHPLAPFTLAMLQSIRLLLAVMAVFLAAKLVLIAWLVWDRRQQRRRDGEFYHTVRDSIAPVVGYLRVLEQVTKQASAELKKDVAETPKKTAHEVVVELAHDSGVLKRGDGS